MNRFIQRPNPQTLVADWQGATSFTPVFDLETQSMHMRSDGRTALDDYMDDVVSWCSDQFGRKGWSGVEPHEHDGRWMLIGITFVFRHENDAFAFKMRWG